VTKPARNKDPISREHSIRWFPFDDDSAASWTVDPLAEEAAIVESPRKMAMFAVMFMMGSCSRCFGLLVVDSVCGCGGSSGRGDDLGAGLTTFPRY
jgi:hypothetical protein